jgi:tetratricopeptide (TPR) repeat protein
MPLTTEHAKALYDLATTVQRAGNHVQAINVAHLLVDVSDPFYAPFGLGILAQSYNALGHRELEVETLKRVTQLPMQQKLLLNPGLVALAYQRTGDLKGALAIQTDIHRLAPNDVRAVAALAELSVLLGDADQAEHWAKTLREKPEIQFQVLGRVINALVLAIREKYGDAMSELNWVGQFIVSTGALPQGGWDYGDLWPLAQKIAQSFPPARLILEVLRSAKPLPEFIEEWRKVAPAA